MSKTKSGFTLVELLIVIVIIAILAAITVVAYNGITDRANKTVIKSDLSKVARSMELFNADNGHHPVTSSELYGGTSAPLRKNSFAMSSDPYYWVLYCGGETEYMVAARQAVTATWFAVGSNFALQETTAPGNSGSAPTTCANLGATSTLQTWAKGNSGWSTSLK